MSLTSAQMQAVAARGNVLVVAGAGTGKTSTLVERCLACLVTDQPPASLDEILMVTFTDAAAAEMRRRIRARLEEQPAAQSDRLRWQEQLALFETAHIGTLHSFCLQLLRQHFYELELDPQLTVLPEEEARLMQDDILDEILRQHYAGDRDFAPAVQQLIQAHGRGWDQPVRKLVLQLHHYTQTLRDPAGWFGSQLAMFDSPEPVHWLTWLIAGVIEWRNRWLPALTALSANPKAAECAASLGGLAAAPSRADCAAVLRQVHAIDSGWPPRGKTGLRKPLEDFFDEAEFLESLARTDRGTDPLGEDWNWTRGQMGALLRLAHEFAANYAEAKRERGAVDFHDLEQHALRLLRDPATGQPSAVAREWREKLRHVFVDEYQDINDAQDAILKALSRDGAAANRFLVGDVKQSIYRFRLADPRIFLNYARTWRGGEGQTIALVDNFRSRESILHFINGLFGELMRPEIGGVAYDDEARLRFGDPANRAALATGASDASPRVELQLRLRGSESAGATEEANESGADDGNLEESGKEARLVARRLSQLHAGGHLIWDEKAKSLRRADWGDMAVLLRSPSGKAEVFAREFARVGVPLVVARSGFYESTEVADLLSLLQLLDNPLQDLPALAVLRSPLVGLSLSELAEVRLALPKGSIWAAVQRYHAIATEDSGWPKVHGFLQSYAGWRRLARQVSLSRCLETVLDATHFAEWLLTQPRGDQRHANVKRLLALAHQFDRFQRQGLYRFLRFVEAQREAETGPEAVTTTGENSVTLMSIHQSKGLEFPVVVVADLGKPFNLSDLRAEIILDDIYGLCPQIKPPHSGQRYPSLPYWLARQRQKQEFLGEELRLLYVATTRARDTLILSGCYPEKKFSARDGAAAGLTTAMLLAGRNYLDWVLAWAAAESAFGDGEVAETGENQWWRWRITRDSDSRESMAALALEAESETATAALDDGSLEKLRARLAWRYPHPGATRLPAKVSVTTLRRQLAAEADDEAKPWIHLPANLRRPASSRKLSGVDKGNAHHKLLQYLALDQTDTVEAISAESARLLAENILSPEELASLDLAAVAAFWRSKTGREIRGHAAHVRRELAFTVRASPAELELAAGAQIEPGEFMIMQGMADLAVFLPREIWLVDFKTDEIDPLELDGRVKTYERQLRLYALALEKIYRRPITRAYLHFLTLRQSVPVPVELGANP